jgi:hypothetical protein
MFRLASGDPFFFFFGWEYRFRSHRCLHYCWSSIGVQVPI